MYLRVQWRLSAGKCRSILRTRTTWMSSSFLQSLVSYVCLPSCIAVLYAQVVGGGIMHKNQVDQMYVLELQFVAMIVQQLYTNRIDAI